MTMPFNLNAMPDEQNVLEAIQSGEGQQIELRERINSALDLGKLVSGFANANGGWVIVGVREPATIVETDTVRLGQFFDNVSDRVRPAQNLMMYPVTLDGKEVRVVVVKPSPVLVMTDAGAFVREGDRTRVMLVEEIHAKSVPPAAPQAPQPEDSAVSIARLTKTVNELLEKFDASQTWAGQKKNLMVGCAGSTLSTLVVAFLSMLFGMFLLWLATG